MIMFTVKVAVALVILYLLAVILEVMLAPKPKSANVAHPPRWTAHKDAPSPFFVGAAAIFLPNVVLAFGAKHLYFPPPYDTAILALDAFCLVLGIALFVYAHIPGDSHG